jgi:Cu(I)/Ag(I) efflux system membrane fusion protein
MTVKEKKLLALGAGAGVLASALLVATLTNSGIRGYAAEKTPSPSMGTARPRVAASQPESDPGTQPGTTLELTPAEITAAGVQVAEVQSAVLKTNIDSFGRVEQPEAQLAAVSARIGGRVDKLYVQYTGESVRRGQAVADVYSPEVATAIEDYRLSQENRGRLGQSDDPAARAQADALVAASQRKLELWGITGKQMEATETSGVPHVTIYAYASGSVVERKVTQGQYVNAGDTLFTVADLSQVWIKADVYEDQLPQIRAGQEVEIKSDAVPGRTLHGHVDFIEPAANPQTRTVPVHVHVSNPGMHLLPGMFVDATFISRAPGESIVVPRSAVLDTGSRKVVYVAKPNGVFEAREVAVGAPSEDLFPVLSGLTRGEKVVLSGNFLIDSQAHLSSGVSGLYGGSKEFAGNPAAASGASSSSDTAAASAAKLGLHIEPNPLKAGEDGSFQAKLMGPDGKPIADAQVKVTLTMPAMPSMSMPEMKSSFELTWSSSQQMYVGNGQAGMPGTWNVTAEAVEKGAVIATLRTHASAR